MQSIQKEKKSPAIKFILIIAGGLSVALFFALSPWNIIPQQMTEDVTVIAVTNYGCVGESHLGFSVVVTDCVANVGETVSATFNVPAMVQNGYYDRIEAKLALVEP